MIDIDYRGRMTDLIPSWAWRVATNYAMNPFDYTKVSEYLKNKYGRLRPKITWCVIDEITSSPTIQKQQLVVEQIENLNGLKVLKSSDSDGKQYYAKVHTNFDIGTDTDNYVITREILMWISELCSSVVASRLELKHNDEVIMVIE